MKIITLFSILVISSIAYASPIEDIKSDNISFLYSQGIKYEAEGKTKIAIDFYIKASEKGQVNSQLAVAQIYENEGNNAQWSKYMHMAANAGSPVAQNKLGLGALYRYYAKHSIEDLSKSRQWLLKSAKQGHFFAQINLAISYMIEMLTKKKNIDLIEVCAWVYQAKETEDYFRSKQRDIFRGGDDFDIYDYSMDRNIFKKMFGYYIDFLEPFSRHCDSELSISDIDKVNLRQLEIKTTFGNRHFLSLDNGSLLEF